MRLILVALLSAISYAQTGAPGGCAVIDSGTTRVRCAGRGTRTETITVPEPDHYELGVVEHCIEVAARRGHTYFTARESRRECDIPLAGEDAQDLCVDNSDSVNNNQWTLYNVLCDDEARYGTEYCSEDVPYGWYEQGRGGMCCSVQPTNDGDVCNGLTGFCLNEYGVTIGEECVNLADKPTGTAMCGEDIPNAFHFYATGEDMCCSVNPTGSGSQQDCPSGFGACIHADNSGWGEVCIDYDPAATTTTTEATRAPGTYFASDDVVNAISVCLYGRRTKRNRRCVKEGLQSMYADWEASNQAWAGDADRAVRHMLSIFASANRRVDKISRLRKTFRRFVAANSS